MPNESPLKLDVPAWDPNSKELTYVAAGDVPALRKVGILTGDEADLASSKAGMGGAIASFVAGAGHGATGGLANDHLLPAITRHIGTSAQRALGFTPEDLRDSPSFQAALEHAQALHPVANFAGNVAGVYGLTAATGGLGELAALANGAIRGVGTGVGIATAGAAARAGTAALLGGIEAGRDSARYNDPKMASAIMQGAVFGGLLGVGGEVAGSVIGRLATKAQRGTAKWLDEAALSGNFFGKKGYEKNWDQVYPGKSAEVRQFFEAQFDKQGFRPRDIEDIRFARRIRPDEAAQINTPEEAREVLRQEQMLSAAVGIPKSKSRLGDALTPLQSGEIPGLLTPDEIEKNLPLQREAREAYLNKNADAFAQADADFAEKQARMAPFMEAHGKAAEEAAAQLDPTASAYNARLKDQRDTFVADASKTLAEKTKLEFLQQQATALERDIGAQKFRAGGRGAAAGAAAPGAEPVPTPPATQPSIPVPPGARSEPALNNSGAVNVEDADEAEHRQLADLVEFKLTHEPITKKANLRAAEDTGASDTLGPIDADAFLVRGWNEYKAQIPELQEGFKAKEALHYYEQNKEQQAIYDTLTLEQKAARKWQYVKDAKKDIPPHYLPDILEDGTIQHKSDEDIANGNYFVGKPYQGPYAYEVPDNFNAYVGKFGHQELEQAREAGQIAEDGFKAPGKIKYKPEDKEEVYKAFREKRRKEFWGPQDKEAQETAASRMPLPPGAARAPFVPEGADPFTTPGAPSHPQNIEMAELAAQLPNIPVPPQRILKRKWTPEQVAARAKQEAENQFKISLHPAHEALHIQAGNALTDPAEIERALAAGTHMRTPKGNVVPVYPENLKIKPLEKATYRADDPAGSVTPKAGAGAFETSDLEAEAPSLSRLSKDTLKKLREKPPRASTPPIPEELDAMMQAHAAAGQPIEGLPDVPGWEASHSPVYPDLKPFEAPAIQHIRDIIPGQRGYTKYTMRRPHIVTRGIYAKALGSLPDVPVAPGVKVELGKLAQGAAVAAAGKQLVERYGTQFAFNHEAALNAVLQRAVAPALKGLALAVRTGIDSAATLNTSKRPIDELAVPTAHTDAAFDAVQQGVTRMAASPETMHQAIEDKLGHVTEGKPQLRNNLANTFAQGVAFLQEALPKPQGQPGALDAGHATIPRSVKRQFLDKYMGVTNPVACLQAPTRANMSAVEATHPDLLSYYREQIQAQLSDPKIAARVMADPELRRRLSLVMGVPMSRNETPAVLASLQSGAVAATANSNQPGPGAPGMAKPPGNATINITGNQARSFAGAGALPQQQEQLDNLGAS